MAQEEENDDLAKDLTLLMAHLTILLFHVLVIGFVCSGVFPTVACSKS